MLITRPAAKKNIGLHLSGTTLLDRDGNTVIMHGSKFTYCYSQSYPDPMPYMATLGANTVNILTTAGTAAGGLFDPPTSASDLSQLISWSKDNKLICMLTPVDTIASNATYPLTKAVAWWKSMRSVLVGQENYVVINIGGEPNSDANSPAWASDHISAIVSLRNAGFNHAFVVDLPDNASQDWQSYGANNAASVLAADTMSNTIFSVHMWNLYASATTINNKLNQFTSNSLPIMVGEYATQDTGANDGQPIDAVTIMAQCVARGLHHIAFGWAGTGDTDLDLVTFPLSTSLSSYGNLIFNGLNGIANTTTRAPIYGPLTQLLSDPFTTLDLTTWTNHGSASVVSAQLSLPCLATYLGGIVLTGTFDFTTARASVKGVQTPNIGNGTTQMIFAVGPTIPGTSWQMFWLNQALYFIENVGGSQTWSGTPVVYNSTNHRYWRIREAGGVIYFDASPDTVAWTNLAQRPNSNGIALTACKIQLDSGFFGTEPSPGTAIFDDLLITTI